MDTKFKMTIKIHCFPHDIATIFDGGTTDNIHRGKTSSIREETLLLKSANALRLQKEYQGIPTTEKPQNILRKIMREV